MGTADLEATLALTINRDDVDAAMASVKADIDKGVQATFAKAAQLFGATLARMGLGGGPGGGGGSSAASTGTPGHAGSPSNGAASTGTPGGGGGSGPPGPGSPSPARPPQRPPPPRRGGSREQEDLVTRSLRSSVGVVGGTAGHAASNSASSIGSALRDAARERAAEIESNGGVGSMGLLRFANPLSAGIAVATAGVGKALGESASAGDKYAAMSRDLSLGARSGAFRDFMEGDRFNAKRAFGVGSGAAYGAMSPEEVAAYGRSFSSQVGYNRVSREGTRDLWRARNTGASDEAINSLLANERVGAAAYDPTRAIGLAQAQGLEGAGIDRFLEAIARNTHSMAMRGIKVDRNDLTDMLATFQRTPGMEGMGERAAAGMAGLQDMSAGIVDELLTPQKQFAKAMMMQRVLAGGGGTYEGLIGSAERFAGSPSEQFAAVQRGGALPLKAVTGWSLDEARAGARPGAVLDENGRPRGAGDKFEMQTLDKVKDDSGAFMLGWKEIQAVIDATRMKSVGSQEGYGWQKGTSANWDRMFQDAGGWFSDLSSDINTGLGKMTTELGQKIESLNTTIKDQAPPR